MSLGKPFAFTEQIGAPRVSGDEPYTNYDSIPNILCSPRERG